MNMSVCTHGRVIVGAYAGRMPAGYRIVCCRCCQQTVDLVEEAAVLEPADEYCDSCRPAPSTLSINVSDESSPRETIS